MTDRKRVLPAPAKGCALHFQQAGHGVLRSSPADRAFGVSNPRVERSRIMKINGACHCGAVSFTAQVDESRVMICHCVDCQVLSGAPFRAVVAVAIESFEVCGTTKSYTKVAASGNRRAQVFCPECATPLYATAPENATSVVIRLGCVEQRAQLKPAVQIWQHSALPWISELGVVPGSAEQQSFLPPKT